MAEVWRHLGTMVQREVLVTIADKINKELIASVVDEFSGLVSPRGATTAMVAVAAFCLTAEAIKNIIRWWKGEISGKRCASNVLGSLGSFSGGMALGAACALGLGFFAGPIGVFVGGIYGSIKGSIVGKDLADNWTLHIFNIPKDEALENAYNYLGVEKDATNYEISSAFRRLALRHHPDRPTGNTKEFLKLQIHLQIIKTARGEAFFN